MKIDLDLSEIFDEDGGELNPSVRDIIVNTVSSRIYKSIERQIQEKVSKIIESEITTKVKETMNSMMPTILDYEFTEINHYGAKGETITVKNRILKDIANTLKWQDGNYDSEKSAYTKVLKNMVEKRMNEFKPQFDRELNAMFVSEAMEYARRELTKKLGIK